MPLALIWPGVLGLELSEINLSLEEVEMSPKPNGTTFAADDRGCSPWGDCIYISGISPEMQPVQKLMSEIAPTDIPVLLVGESGTGKEVVALQIRALSKYHDLPFAKFSCATLTLDSFHRQLRAFENRHTEENGKGVGTLFFDEISELDGNCQRHLLHSLPGGDGLPSEQSLTGRILSCTTRELECEVQAGRFPSGLFYRLNGVCLRLPPLRRRKEDIPRLVQFFLNKYAKLFGRTKVNVSERALRLLTDYSWPGNIRELENVIKKIVALENEELAVSDLAARPMESSLPPLPTVSHSLKSAARAASRQAERELILQALARTHWNRRKAAEALQISYKSLLYKLKQIRVLESEGV
jgi:DNA-binding NtrC family response regulator